MITPPPKNLGWFHPVTLLATWFWSGLSRFAPGTMGTIAAVPFGAALMIYGGPEITIAAAVLVFIIGIWVADSYTHAVNEPDPGAVVIDEVAAFWLVLAAVPPTLTGFCAAFVLFRFFDIVKPPPIKRLERVLHGGLGIMIDDIMAALYAIATYWLTLEVFNRVFV